MSRIVQIFRSEGIKSFSPVMERGCFGKIRHFDNKINTFDRRLAVAHPHTLPKKGTRLNFFLIFPSKLVDSYQNRENPSKGAFNLSQGRKWERIDLTLTPKKE